jgi:hypothetical protein
MDNKPRNKRNDSSWTDDDRITNPNRRQEEDADDVETQRNQRASRPDSDSSESTPSRGDEQLHKGSGSPGRQDLSED